MADIHAIPASRRGVGKGPVCAGKACRQMLGRRAILNQRTPKGGPLLITKGDDMTRKKFVMLSSGVVAVIAALTIGLGFLGGPTAFAKSGSSCKDLPKHSELEDALMQAQGEENGGFGLNMWATIVNRDGQVCGVVFTGNNRGDQWPGSRVISAQKANTANAFSLPGLALSTANLFAPTQPGAGLFGLQFSNPVDTDVAYAGPAGNYGSHKDPMVNERIGGVNVFGGGLALYDSEGKLLGAVGVSGDSSCADHNIAWKTRDYLALDNIPGGVNPDDGTDNIIYIPGNGFGHSECGGGEVAIAQNLTITNPIGP